MIIDYNKDNFIDTFEWSEFRKIFLIPFTECDTTGGWVMDEADFNNCVDN